MSESKRVSKPSTDGVVVKAVNVKPNGLYGPGFEPRACQFFVLGQRIKKIVSVLICPPLDQPSRFPGERGLSVIMFHFVVLHLLRRMT